MANQLPLALPRSLALKSKSNGKYLRYTHETTEQHGLLQVTGAEAVSTYAKFHVEPSTTSKDLVHIRCAYNNKYWRRWTSSQFWIGAFADTPEEDRSKWSCTLFKPELVEQLGNRLFFRFLHVQLNHYACLTNAAAPYFEFWSAGWEDPQPNDVDVCEILDWESYLVLPKHVAFKGDNGKYLRTSRIEDHEYLQFSGTDPHDERTGYQVFRNPDGSVRIKADHLDKFWRRSPNWIWADSTDPTADNPDTVFWPVKLDKNVVALRNYGNNNFCKRLTTEGKTSCLNAGVSTVAPEARMEVEELVLSREIFDVDFRVADAIIHETRIIVAQNSASNYSDETQTFSMKLTHTESTSSTWSSNVSLKLGVETTLKSGVPFISDGEIEITAEFCGPYSWGEPQKSSSTMETTYEAPVPPHTLLRVRMMATKGACDVPFSYTQRDTLVDGSHVTYRMDDGIYTGVSSYNFNYETTEEKLPQAAASL